MVQYDNPPAALILNDRLVNEINFMHEYTKREKQEVAGFLIRGLHGGVGIVSPVLGKGLEVDLEPNEDLHHGESYLGTFHCILNPKTNIETIDGHKWVCDIGVGDLVLTEDGNYHKVDYVGKHRYTGSIYRIEVDYYLDSSPWFITVTPNHPIMTISNDTRKWKSSSEITNIDEVVMPSYLFDKCKSCSKDIPYGRSYCNRKCLGIKRREENLTEEFRQKVKAGVALRNKREEYKQHLSQGIRRGFKEGYYLDRLRRYGFANPETQRKAQNSLVRSRRNGSYWQIRLFNELKEAYPILEVELNYPVRGDQQIIRNQFSDKIVGNKQKTYFLDIAFPSLKVDIEVDGEAYHSSPEQRLRDSNRDRYLINTGWKVIRIPVREIASKSYASKITETLGLVHIEDPPIKFIQRRVLRVERLHAINKLIYDIGVEGNHTFVANGILTHNTHPLTETFSPHDIATFLADPTERVSICYGADGVINLTIKTDETEGIGKEDITTLKEAYDQEEIPDLAMQYKFLYYRGQGNRLEIFPPRGMPVNMVEQPLDEFVHGIMGEPNIPQAHAKKVKASVKRSAVGLLDNRKFRGYLGL